MASDELVPLPVDEGLVSEVVVEGWAPRDDVQVEGALRLLDRLARRDGLVREQAAAWREQIDEWERTERAKLSFPATRAVLGLESFALAQRRVTGTKSFSYPSGRIETKAGRDKVVVTDEAALLAWARDAAPAAVKVVESVLVSKLPEHVVTDDGRMVVEGGEAVPGVTVQSGANYTTATVRLTSNRELPKA